MRRAVPCLLAPVLLIAWLGAATAADCAKRRCGQMRSCAEAYAVLADCGRRGLDRDGDGIPCEAICGPGLTPAERRAEAAAPAFACAPRKACRQMSGCAEARFHLMVCGVRSLDSDGDGIPCEAICTAR